MILAIDVPAKLGIIGAGPAGLEAALYARFLGYEVVIFERGLPAERLQSDDNAKLGAFGDLSSTLGRAAIAAQTPDKPLPALTMPMTAKTWREIYLLPLSNCDLVVDCLRLEKSVTRVFKEHLEGVDLLGFERGGYDFVIETRDVIGQLEVTTVDGLIDASGLEVRDDKSFADFTFAEGLHLHLDAATGALTNLAIEGDELPDGAKLTEGSRRLILHEPNFYVIGDKSAPATGGLDYWAILAQIKALFTILGDRTSLDLYATAVTLPQ
jgi:hypothetical protein